MAELMEIKEIGPIKAACIDGKGPYNEMGPLFVEINTWIKANNIKMTGTPGIALECGDPVEVGPENCRYTVCVPIKGTVKGNERIKIEKLPKIKAACLIHKGSYKQLPDKWQEAMRWINEKGYKIADTPREAYLNDCWGTPENELLTEIQIPIA